MAMQTSPTQRHDEHLLDRLRITVRQLDACALDATGRRVLARLRRRERKLTQRVLARNPAWRSTLQRARRWTQETMPPSTSRRRVDAGGTR
jgi:hypothetical protein